MSTKIATVLFTGGLLLGLPGWLDWLAEALASEDPDVEAAIEAYEAEDWDTARARLDEAVDRQGERAELAYDRGLIQLATGNAEDARSSFEHGTESELAFVRASAHYELGNLDFDAEAWEPAISHYIDCLRADPNHQNAKWNLELALLRKQEQDKKEQEEQDQQDQENQDGEQDQDQQDGEQDQEQQDQQDGEQDQQQGDEQEQQDQQDGEQGQQQGDEQEQQEQQDQQQDQQGGQQEQQDQQDQQDQQQGQQAQAKPVESGDIDAALDELDRQDAFMFGRPRGRQREVEKDW